MGDVWSHTKVGHYTNHAILTRPFFLIDTATKLV